MKLSALLGSCNQSSPFVYTACDCHYFDDFAQSMIISVLRNTDLGVHVHIFNPNSTQISWCESMSRVSVTYEHIGAEEFALAADFWNRTLTSDIERKQLERTLNAMKKGNDQSMLERMQKTYFACARFIRLAEISSQQTIFAMDVDAVARLPIPVLPPQHDFYIHYIPGSRARHLAGGIWLNATAGAQQFLGHYSRELQQWIERDYLYWGLDQDVLDSVVPLYNRGQLPKSYIDWDMHANSCVWTAKGTRKESVAFVNEKKKYSV